MNLKAKIIDPHTISMSLTVIMYEIKQNSALSIHHSKFYAVISIFGSNFPLRHPVSRKVVL